MILCFVLSMPGVSSWDGKWSGENDLFAIVSNMGRSKENNKKAQKILDQGSYSYSFGDGWRACVSVKAVDSKEAAKIKRKSKGFSGYDWMVKSIKLNGTIECD